MFIFLLLGIFSDSLNMYLKSQTLYECPYGITSGNGFLYTRGGDSAEFISVYSYSNPYHPELINVADYFTGSSKGIEAPSFFKYYRKRLIFGHGIINVEDPYNIFSEGSFTSGYIRNMQISDTILYTYEDYYGFKLYSLSDPSHPVLLSTYVPESLSIKRFFVMDTLCYLTDGMNFEVVDVKDPTNPKFLYYCNSVIPDSSDYQRNLIGKGNYLYLVLSFNENGYYYDTLYTLRIEKPDSVDINDKAGRPDSISISDKYGFPYDYYPEDIELYVHNYPTAISDTLLFCVQNPQYVDSNYIHSFSLSQPGQIIPMRSYLKNILFRGFINMAYIDSLLYITTYWSGIQVFSSKLERVGWSCYSGGLNRVVQKSGLIYTLSFGSGIRIFKYIADSLIEITKGGQPILGMDIAVIDTLAYIADYENGIDIYSVADPSKPRLIRQFSGFPDTLRSTNIAVDSNYIYITRSYWPHPDEPYHRPYPSCFYILDRDNLSIISSMDSVRGTITLNKPFAYIGAQVIDLKDATNPWVITTLDPSNYACYNSLYDTLLYISTGKLYSVADPAYPEFIDSILSGTGEIRGDSLYIIHSTGYDYFPQHVSVYDITHPDAPNKVAYGHIRCTEITCVYPFTNKDILAGGVSFLYHIGLGAQGIKEDKIRRNIGTSIVFHNRIIYCKARGKFSLNLYDVVGRKVKSATFINKGKMSIDNLPSGIYFARIPEFRLTKKVILIK